MPGIEDSSFVEGPPGGTDGGTFVSKEATEEATHGASNHFHHGCLCKTLLVHPMHLAAAKQAKNAKKHLACMPFPSSVRINMNILLPLRERDKRDNMPSSPFDAAVVH